MKVDRATYIERIKRMAKNRPLTLSDAQRAEMRLWRDPADRFVAFYAPFDYVNASARIALIGATPGHGQVPTALTVFRDALAAGKSERTAMRHRSLFHTTSAVRYPTFVRKGDSLVPYTGSNPSPVDRPRLREMVDSLLGPELRRCRVAVILPVGNGAHDAVQHLVARGVVPGERCLFGLPHPSGQNAGRHRDVVDNRRALRAAARRAAGASWPAAETS